MQTKLFSTGPTKNPPVSYSGSVSDLFGIMSKIIGSNSKIPQNTIYCLTESLRELKVNTIPGLLQQLRELNSKKCSVREVIGSCKETVDAKIAENERVYEVIRVLETNMMDIQGVMMEVEDKSGEEQGEQIKELNGHIWDMGCLNCVRLALSERCEKAIADAEMLLRELVSNPPLEKSFQANTQTSQSYQNLNPLLSHDGPAPIPRPQRARLSALQPSDLLQNHSALCPPVPPISQQQSARYE